MTGFNKTGFSVAGGLWIKRCSQFVAVMIVIGVIAVIGISPAAAQPEDLPAGPGAEIFRRDCLSCHGADLTVSQRLSRAGWVREIEKMVRWGAVIGDSPGPNASGLVSGREALTDYLATNFAPRRKAASRPGAVAGKEIFARKCLLCHEADLSTQQRLSRAGWVREVEKMIRWGAVVTDTEKDPLIDYLLAAGR